MCAPTPSTTTHTRHRGSGLETLDAPVGTAEGSADDVSLGYFVLLIPGFLLWVLYGLPRHDWPLVIPNTVATAVALVIIAVAAQLKRNSARSAEVQRSGGTR